MKHGKKYVDSAKLIDSLNAYDPEEAVALAKLHTRQYAKRQLTWFRNRLKNLPAAFPAN